MNSFIKILLASVLAISVLSAQDDGSTPKKYTSVDDIGFEDRTKLRAPLQNLFSSTEWGVFLKEFEIKRKIGFCGSGVDKSMGFEAHMAQPLGYLETTKKPLYFPFADLDLGGNILKSCSSRASSKEESSRDECFNQHFIYAPIMGMIFKKKLKFVCFSEGDIALPLISEFNPAHLVDVYGYKMIPHMIAMFSPQAIVSSILNCGATTAYSAIKGYSTKSIGDSGAGGAEQTFNQDEWAQGYKEPDLRNTNYSDYNSLKEKGIKGLAFVRNSMYYNVGCLGFSPVGGYVRGQDPGVDNAMLGYSAIANLHGFSAATTVPLLQKKTEFSIDAPSFVSGADAVSTMCRPRNFAMPIESQYLLQRAYPTVGTAKEMGETGAASTTLANVPGSKDSFVNVVWERRDYYAFAYMCKDKTGQTD